MSRESGGVKSQSLGELIVALRPGQPCPLCGGRLQRRGVLRRIKGVTSNVGLESCGPILDCPECGCEVSPAGDSANAPCRLSLGAAA